MSKQICVVLAALLVAAGCGKKTDAALGTGNTTSASAPAGGTIKLGQTVSYSGPASAYGVIGKVQVDYVKMINEKKGGIHGRKIDMVSLDDGYNPAKTVEQTRKLVESENVLAIFGSIGTGPAAAVHSYLNEKKVPQVFIATGGDKWADPAFPWTVGFQPSYRVESRIYAHYILETKPNAKLCMLHQNDDFGKDFQNGLKEGLAGAYDKIVVKLASYEVTDPTVDSQIVTLQAAGCDTLVLATTPKFAAQAIRKVADIGWKPLIVMGNVSASITAVLKPAGLDKSTGIITGAFLKDPSDPKLADDPGLNEYRAFMKQWAPELDVNDNNAVSGFSIAVAMEKVLEQCGDDLSRVNIMKQALDLKMVDPVVINGIEVNTSPTDFRPISQLQLARFNGTSFELFGKVLSGD